MPGANTDKFLKGARKLSGTIDSSGIINGTVDNFGLGSGASVPTDSGVEITIDRVDSNGAKTPDKEETIRGVVSGDRIVSAVRGVEGTAQAHSAGAVWEMRLTASMWNRLIDGLLTSFTQTGKLILSAVDSIRYGADSGGDDTYSITLNPVPAAYYAGMEINFLPTTSNTGACTLDVNGLGAKTIKKNVSSDLEDGDISAGKMVKVLYDGTNFQIVNLPALTLSQVRSDSQVMEYGMARQAIMNGNFDVWQRGTSVALADVTGKLLADRWADYVDKNGGTLPTITRSQQLLTSGDIPGAKYFIRLATNGSGTSLGVSSQGVLYQKIENGTSKLCGNGKKVTVSFWAKSDIANKRICPTLVQNYGTGGSPTADEVIKGTPITLTSTWTKYTVTFTTNTLVGKTFGTNNDDALQLLCWYMWGTTTGNASVQASVTAETFVGAGNIDIAQVQLCAGDVALPFQPKSFEEELRSCQRYYETSVGGDGNFFCGNVTSGSTYYSFPTQYKVTKRIVATPILATLGQAGFPAVASTTFETNVWGYTAQRTANGTGSAQFYRDSYTVDAEL